MRHSIQDTLPGVDKNLAVLVVDDHQSMRRTIADILRTFGIRDILYAEDGEQAMQKLADAEVDLVLLDWNMPNMSGIELLKVLRGSEEFKTLPVIMVTAEAERDDVVEAVQEGVTDYIVKPFLPDTLRKKILAVFK